MGNRCKIADKSMKASPAPFVASYCFRVGARALFFLRATWRTFEVPDSFSRGSDAPR